MTANKAKIVTLAATLAFTGQTHASIGFTKDDCAVYGNLIEQTETKHVYENKYVKYTFTYDENDIVKSFKVTFEKGTRPSLELMTAVMPNPISKKDRLWKNSGRTSKSMVLTS